MALDRTLLVTITGRDRPGVTAAVFDALTGFPGAQDVEVVDVEQVVIRGRLVLGVLVAPGTEEAGLRAAVAKAAHGLGMDVEIASGTGDNLPRREGRLHVTVLG